MEQILSRLDKVRKQGDRYVACCPVHGDKNPSMQIKDVGDKILMYCFSCQAKGPEIINALGLPMSLIFKENNPNFDKSQWLLDKTRVEDELFIHLYESAKAKGERIRSSDIQRYRVSIGRQQAREGRQQSGQGQA